MAQQSKQTIKKAHSGLSYLFFNLPKTEKLFHLLIVLWVVWQLATSFGMHVHGDTLLSQITLIDNLHIYGGLGLFIFAILFFTLVLHRRKTADLYPWLHGHWTQLNADCRTLLGRQLPEPSAGGLAATVEGLGLLALLLAVVTGSLWFVAINNHFDIAPTLLKIHKTSVGAIELYFYGHFAFAMLHLINWWRKTN